MRVILYVFCIAGLVIIYSCQSALIKKENKRITDDQSIIKHEILAQLRDIEDQSTIETDYRKYNLVSKKIISSHMKAVIFTYDTTTVSPAKIMFKLKEDDRFSMVEFNKLLSVRDR